MSHYNDAKTLLALADAAALRGLDAAEAEQDPLASIPNMIGALIHLLAAQVHATLAVADKLERETL